MDAAIPEEDPNAMDHASMVERILQSQRMLQDTFAGGRVPVDEEIKGRLMMATFLIQSYDALRHPPFIDVAIQHLETVLRRAAPDSPEYPGYLGKLAQARMSEYLAIDSRHALDLAVQKGHQALDAARAVDLQNDKPEVHSSILTELAHARSLRHQISKDPEDLDIAIVCTMELSKIASAGSDLHRLSLNNLASQLRRRSAQNQDPADLDEATRLTSVLLDMTATESIHYALAKGQLASIAYERFSQTESPADLDDAIEHGERCLRDVPDEHQMLIIILLILVGAYEARYEDRKVLSDLAELVRHGERLSSVIPLTHSDWARHFEQYLKHTEQYMSQEPSPELLSRILPQLRKQIDQVNTEDTRLERCQLHFSNLLGHQYSISSEFHDFVGLVDFFSHMIDTRNRAARRPGSTRQAVESRWISELKLNVNRLTQSSSDNPMRELAEQEIFGAFLSLRTPGKAAAIVLTELYDEHHIRLSVLVNAMAENRTLSELQLDTEVQSYAIRGENDARKSQRQTTSRTSDHAPESGSREPAEASSSRRVRTDAQRTEQLRPPSYVTESGLRQLSIDPETGNVIFDLSGLIADKLGYDPNVTLSPAEFLAREEAQEQQAIDRARSQERHPNTDLCRMCRDFARVLRPSEEGFELTAENCILPFGNFYQLMGRQHCKICRLIYAAITTSTGELNPQLSAIDLEIQGTRLSTGTLSSGEKVMRVDYGLKHVCDLRVITQRNRKQAIRQAWEEANPSSQASSVESFDNLSSGQGHQQLNLRQIKGWLNNCDHVHGSSCNSEKSDYLAASDMPVIFIDVVDDCLVAKTTKEKYYALSYVWGAVDMHQTTKANIKARKQHLSLSRIGFPKTITDAMSFVRSLGDRFLWIDALCIAQDDHQQLARDIPRMNIVYGKSFATLVAVSGEDADGGLPGVRPSSRPPQEVSKIRVSGRSPVLDYDSRSEQFDEICLIASPPALHLALDTSRWITRGWIFQERLLSRRCVYFFPDAVYFQCGMETLSECSANEVYSSSLFGKTPMRDEHILKRANHDNPLNDVDKMSYQPIPRRNFWAFEVYKRLIEVYTRRQFSFKGNILRGFAGVFAVLNRHFHGETVFGLPVAIFPHALLWSPAARLPRRGCRLPTPSDTSMGKPDRQFPSWSWAGWDGPVEYRLFNLTGGDTKLPTLSVARFRIGSGASQKIIKSGEFSSGLVEELPADDPANSLYIPIEHEQTSGISDHESTTGNSKTTDNERKPIVATDSKEQETKDDRKGKGRARDFSQIETPVGLIGDPSHQTTWVVAPPQSPQEPWDPVDELTILSFEASTLPFTSFRLSPEKEYLSKQSHIHTATQQAVRRIYDSRGQHCGLWWEQAGYGYVGLDMESARAAEQQIHLVAISRYGSVWHARKGLDRVEGEIPFFDHDVYRATGPGSLVVNVLVVDADLDRPEDVGYRCTVAVIHGQAWLDAEPRKRTVRIA